MANQNEGRAALASRRPSGCLSRQNDTRDIAQQRSFANALTAVMDPQGVVIAVVAGRVAARSFMRGGCE